MKKSALFAVLTAASVVVANAQNAPAGTADKGQLEEVVITGTLIRGLAPIGQPTTTVDNATIVSSGVTNTADLLATQPALNSFNTLPIGGNQAFRSTASTVPGMRGLPGTAVLVMLDGHRLVGDSPLLTTADPSSIPAGAIERVEIIQDGGSATYGSDAVAGVINIILKKNFSGAETTMSGTRANSYSAGTVGQTFGKTWSGGSALLSASYERNGSLQNGERNFYLQDYRPFGGADRFATSCGYHDPTQTLSTNVLLDNGKYYNSANMAVLPVTPQATPLSATNPARSNYVPPVTQGVSCDPRQYNDLIPSVRRYAIVGNIRHDLNEHVHLFADAKFTDTYTRQLYTPTNLVVNDPTLNASLATRQTSGTLIIPGTNPFFLAPAGYTVTPTSVEQVFVNSRTFGSAGDIVNTYGSKSYMLDLGATADLWGDWQATADFNFGYSTSQAYNPDSTGPNPNALLAAANGTTTATALDPFNGRTNPAVIAAIMNWPLTFNALQRIYDLNIRADGKVMTLPGGDMKLAVGFGNRHEQYSGNDPIGAQGQPNALDPNVQYASRLVNAVNAEVAVPVFGAPNSLPGLRKLLLSVAARYDRYSDFGNTTNPKFGFTWSPIEDLSLRASYGKSFHAPQLADSNAIDTRVTAGVTTASSVVPNNFPAAQGLSTIGFAGGRPGLKPETAKTYSIGFDFKPSFVPGLGISATYFDIKYENAVVIPTANQTTINNPALAGTVYVYNQISATGCSATGAAVAPGTGGPCYAPISQAILDTLLTGVRKVNFTGSPTTYFVSDLRRTNLGSNLIQGIDWDISYRHALAGGTLSSTFSGEYIKKFMVQNVPGGVYNDALTSGLQYFQNDAGAQSIIPWHARGTLGYQTGALSTQAAVSYTGSYLFAYLPADYSVNPNGVNQATTLQKIKPFVTVDLNAIWDFPNDNGPLKGLRIQINAYNVFNKPPPFVLSDRTDYGGFFSPSASPLGRTVRLSLAKRW